MLPFPVISHGGQPIMLCNEGETEFGAPSADASTRSFIKIIQTVDCLQPVLNVIPFQLMAYWLGVLKGNEVDFPRNVAKSVTVE